MEEPCDLFDPVAVGDDVLMPRLLNLDAPLLRPLDVTVGQRAEGVDDGLRPLLVDLVEQRREDAPCLDELRRRDEERLRGEGTM